MIDLQLLTPASDFDEHRAAWEARVALYAEALARHGVAVRGVTWTEAERDAPALACLAWGYHLRPREWRGLLDGWRADVPLVNAPALLGWNTDKRYLLDLEAAGAAVVPTRFEPLADAGALAAAREAFGTGELVVKPRVSAAAFRTGRVGPRDPAPDLPDAMVQPFLPAVGQEGELSVFLFGGRYSHAVRKVAAPGDFRVQREYAGRFTVVDADAEMLAVAHAAVAAAPVPPTYARVDLIRLSDGRLGVMELELIEPDLYLDLVPAAADLFAGAVASAVVGAQSA